MRGILLAAAIALLAAALAGCGGAMAARDPRVVTLGGDLSNRFMPAAQENQVVARIRVATRAWERAKRPPVNLALIVDTSGSMEGRPIRDARAASLALLDSLQHGDRLAVVVFHSRTQVLVPSTVLGGSSVTEIRRRLSAISAVGTTDMAGGLRAGLEEVVRNLNPSGINRVVLLGDGVPNLEAGIAEMAQAAGERGVSITALGLGAEFNETLMGSVAQLSGGRFHFVEDSRQVAGYFQNEVLRLNRVYARHATLQLTPGPGVRIDSIVGQRVSQSDAGVRVGLGDISHGERRDLIVKMTVQGKRDGAPVELLDAVLQFEDGVVGAGNLERRVFLGAHATTDAARLAEGRSEEVARAALRVQAAAYTVEAIQVARGGELDRARQILETAALQLEGGLRGNRDAELEEQVRHMRQAQGVLSSVAPEASRPPPAEFDQDAAHDIRASRVLRSIHSEAINQFQ